MTITLADIVESEKICAAATEGPWEWEWVPDGPYNELKLAHLHIVCDADESVGATQDREFIAHARKMLPDTLRLVREMYPFIVYLSKQACLLTFSPRMCKESGCEPCKARLLVEQLDGEPTP